MSIRCLYMCAALSALAACPEPSPQFPAGGSPEIAQACALTERKCTACHERERFTTRRHTPEQWKDIVDKMRLFPGSSISPGEATTILTCLNQRSSTTSLDTHLPLATPVATVLEAEPVYVALRGEVQPMHIDLHNRVAQSECSSVRNREQSVPARVTVRLTDE